jgi:hypothetical protein
VAAKTANRIQLYFHCRRCVLAGSASQIEVGLTSTGLQVWCRLHQMEVGSFTPKQLAEQLLTARCECCPNGLHVN